MARLDLDVEVGAKSSTASRSKSAGGRRGSMQDIINEGSKARSEGGSNEFEAVCAPGRTRRVVDWQWWASGRQGVESVLKGWGGVDVRAARGKGRRASLG